jgi:GNAT superfamily N-acetyltransferase
LDKWVFDKEGLEIMEIRKLAESDYDMVVELYKELDELHVQARPDYFVHRDKDEIYPKDAFVHNLSHPGVLELGTFENEQLVGFIRASLWEESGMVKDVKTVCLDNIYVLPAYRRRGVAARLFAEFESWAKEQGAVRLDLHTWGFNKSAIALYQAMGMTPQRYVFEKKL